MTKKIITIMGVVLLLVGIAGFMSPHLLGRHLTPFHNVVHLVTGALAVYFGTKGSISGARTYSFVFGAVYGLLGLAGFIAGHADDRLLTVIPGHFTMGTADHVVHVVIALVFVAAGVSMKPATVNRPLT